MNLNHRNKNLLDLMLSHMPYYGAFDVYNILTRIENKQIDKVKSLVTSPIDQAVEIGQALVSFGYANKRDDIEAGEFQIELRKRGRWLKELGSIAKYQIYQQNKKNLKKAAEQLEKEKEEDRKTSLRIEGQLRTANIWIAVGTCLAGLIAIIEIGKFIYNLFSSE